MHKGSSEVAKAPLCWRKVMLGKVKCPVMGHFTRDLVGLEQWCPVPAEWAGTQQLPPGIESDG